MTAPVPPVAPIPPVVVVPTVPLHQSLLIRLDALANSLITKLVGIGMALFFGHLDYLEVVKTRQSIASISIFSGLAVFGVALALTQPFVSTAKSIIVVVGPYIPTLGRRKEDAS